MPSVVKGYYIAYRITDAHEEWQREYVLYGPVESEAARWVVDRMNARIAEQYEVNFLQVADFLAIKPLKSDVAWYEEKLAEGRKRFSSYCAVIEELVEIAQSAPDDIAQENGTSSAQCHHADEDDQPPPLKPVERQVLIALSAFDPSDLVSAPKVRDAMDPRERLSERTIRPAIRQLVALGFAEYPYGNKQGARLTMAGRRLASKISI